MFAVLPCGSYGADTITRADTTVQYLRIDTNDMALKEVMQRRCMHLRPDSCGGSGLGVFNMQRQSVETMQYLRSDSCETSALGDASWRRLRPGGSDLPCYHKCLHHTIGCTHNHS